MLSVHQPALWQRQVQRLAALRPCSWALSRLLPQLDGWELRRSHGEHSLTTLFTGLPVITLHTTGARNGLPRRAFLVAIPHGERIVLIASNFGSPQHPAWYHNLVAQPQARLVFRGEEGVYTAREATGAEREALWGLAVASYAGFEAYRRRAASRRIPVMVLEPPDLALGEDLAMKSAGE